jgi:transcription initiation factor TFIIIB Brf1 subunit/transcription initiation factor TFIIB
MPSCRKISLILLSCDYLAVTGRAAYAACSYYHSYSSSGDDNLKEDEATVVIAAAIFLACKVSEEPRRIRDVINVVKAAKGEDVIQMDFDEVCSSHRSARIGAISARSIGVYEP